MESGNASGSSETKTIQVATPTPSENSHVSPDKKLKSPPSHSSGEAVQLGEHNAEDQNIPVSSYMPRDGSGSAHAMELSPNSTAAPNRIPSSVFARTSTASPIEWSVASNESLFSIQMGNASFSREQLSWMSKSGELGYINGDHQYSPFSGPLEQIPSNYNQAPPAPTKESGDDQGPYGVNAEAAAAAAAAETMMEVLREKESQQHKDNVAGTKESPHLRSMSQHSDASVKSFAFPILTGDTDKSSSLRKSTKNKNPVRSQPSSSTNKTTSGTTNITQTTSPESPKPQTSPETPKLSQTPKTTRNAGQSRWFSCFSCCPSSS